MAEGISYMVRPGVPGEFDFTIVGGIAGNISPDVIIEIICDYFRLNKKNVISKDRHRELVEARFICMYFLRAIKRLPLKSIGIILGGLDHTTIIHGLQHLKDLMKNEENIRYDVGAIKGIIRNYPNQS